MRRAVLLIVLLLAVARLAAPYVIRQQINRSLAAMPGGYTGRVEDVSLALWRGGLQLSELAIYKGSAAQAVPLFAAERIETRILWSALWRGGIVGSVWIDRPNLVLVARSDAEAARLSRETKTDVTKAAAEALRPGTPVGDLIRLVPVRMDRVELRDGVIAFRKTDAKPPVDLHLDQVEVVVRNLTNSEGLSGSMTASLDMTARAQDSGAFELQVTLNPLADPIDFDLRSKLLHLAAVSTNSVAREYGGFDFERGTLDLIVEAKVRDGRIRGYVKPLLHNIEIAAAADRTRDDDSLLQRAYEAIVGAVEDVVENRGKLQSGSRIPIDGALGEPGTDLFGAVTSVLRNAYVRALTRSYEGAPTPAG